MRRSRVAGGVLLAVTLLVVGGVTAGVAVLSLSGGPAEGAGTTASTQSTATAPANATTPGRPSTATATGRGDVTAAATTPPTPTATPTTGTATPTTGTVTSAATPAPTATPVPTATPPTTTTATPTATPTDAVVVTVTNVVDGDTIDVRYSNGSTDTVRLLGVDTPEVFVENDPEEFEGVPDTEAGRECLAEEGEDASDYAKRTLEGEQVRLQFDEAADRRGSFGRLLAYVVVDGENVNYRLVADGYARVYDSTFSQSDRFYDAESAAQSSETGVWRCRSVGTATATATPTGTGTNGTDALAVQSVHADAAGNDNENLDDEYVVFENTGSEALDLGGWRVADEADHTYTFPVNFTLGAGETVTLYTGSGTDSDSELYWGRDSAVWNNGGDTVFVYTADGEQVLAHTYQ